MKHCPQCSIDFADTFEDCFQCGTELVDGAVEAGKPEVQQVLSERQRKSEREARSLFQKMKIGVTCFLAAAVGAMITAVLLDPSLDIKAQWCVLHQEGPNTALLREAGALRTPAETANLREKTGLQLAAPGPDEMTVFFPVTSRKSIPTYMPKIVEVKRANGGVSVLLGRSEQKSPAQLRAIGAVLDVTQKLAKASDIEVPKPALQFVVSALVEAAPGQVRFFAPKDLGIEEDEQIGDIALDMAKQMTLGWYRSFLWYAIGGVLLFILFFWVVLKYV